MIRYFESPKPSESNRACTSGMWRLLTISKGKHNRLDFTIIDPRRCLLRKAAAIEGRCQ